MPDDYRDLDICDEFNGDSSPDVKLIQWQRELGGYTFRCESQSSDFFYYVESPVKGTFIELNDTTIEQRLEIVKSFLDNKILDPIFKLEAINITTCWQTARLLDLVQNRVVATASGHETLKYDKRILKNDLELSREYAMRYLYDIISDTVMNLIECDTVFDQPGECIWQLRPDSSIWKVLSCRLADLHSQKASSGLDEDDDIELRSLEIQFRVAKEVCETYPQS